MSNFIVPNTFVPGTKAKAQEVNENFVSVQDELNQKAEKEGSTSQVFSVADAVENFHAVSKSQMDNAISTTSDDLNNLISSIGNPFSVENGYKNSNGNPVYMASSGGVLSFLVNSTNYGPIVAMPANNLPRFSVTSVNSIDLSAYNDDTYNVFLKSNGTAYVYKNTIYIQKGRPSSPEVNTVFVNTSVVPITAKIYQNSSWVDFNDVYLGSVTVRAHVITSVKHVKFNDNGFNVNRKNQYVIETIYKKNASWYRIWSDGWIEQGGQENNTTSGASVSLLKAFSDTNYTVIMQSLYPSYGGAMNIGAVEKVSGTTFNHYHAPNTSQSWSWYACGY